MNDQQFFEHIVCHPKVLADKPVIKGTRLSVEFILNLLAHGSTVDEIVDEYQGLTVQDIEACMR